VKGRPTPKYTFHFMVLQFLPDDGRYTRPKHVVEDSKVHMFKCCGCSDNENSRLTSSTWTGKVNQSLYKSEGSRSLRLPDFEKIGTRRW
jgi:hypothetical protein